MNKTYVNVVYNIEQIPAPQNTLADWLIANPGSGYNDPGHWEFAVEITVQQYNDFLALNHEAFFHDGLSNQPKWQQETDGSGSTTAFGSFADPENDQSIFTTDVSLIDDRWIVRVFDQDPVANPGTAIHLGIEEFDEGFISRDPDVVGSEAERFIQLFSSADVASGTNAANQRTEIGGKMMDFDFGSSDGLSAGVARFNVKIDKAGTGIFPSNHRYRIIGPAGEVEYCWKVFGKSMDIILDV